MSKASKKQRNKRRLLFLGKRVLEMSSSKNIHSLALESSVSVQTGYKYIRDSEGVKAIDLETIASFLIKGCGMTEEEVLNMKFGEVFSFVDTDD